MTVRILLDCDPGHDDAVAIVVAARYAELLGITTVAGNAPLERTTRNALVVRELLGSTVPVHSGADRPLLEAPHPAPHVHGISGLDGADLPVPARPVDGTDAVGFIVDTCRAVEGVWLVGVGPLTNLALALRAAPDLATCIAGISVMGGGAFGNRSAVAEFNIWADPEAAAVVFGYGGPLVMAGLDLTHQLLATPLRLDAVRARPGRAANVFADLFSFFSTTYIARHDDIAGAAVHDPCAVLALTHPDLFERERRHVAIETAGHLTRGMTVIDRRTLKDRPAPNCDVLTRIDADAAWELIVEAIASAARHEELTYGAMAMTDDAATSYPRESARTQRYTLGEPRDVVGSPDGARIVFLRSRGGTDPVNCLWVVDATTGEERLVGDPNVLLAGRQDEELPPEERARRERAREVAGGITTFATDDAVTVTAFAIAGRLFVGGLLSGEARELPVAGPVFDPRPDPLAQRVAYVSGRLLCIGELDGRWHVLAGGEDDERESITWGSADFIAAEEMGRFRGYWWSPDGNALAVTRVNTAPVQRWHIADAADPAATPRELAYPAAGTPNADVTLHVIGLDRSIVDVEWDRDRFPYLADVRWSEAGLIATVQSRDQRDLVVLAVDATTGATEAQFEDHDEAWVELVGGVPRLLADGTIVTCADRDGARRLLVGEDAVTPPDLQVRAVAAADETGITFTANAIDDPTAVQVWRRDPDGTLRALTDEPGVHSVATGGPTVVVRTTTLTEPGGEWATLDGVVLLSHATTPSLRADVHVSFAGESRIPTAVLLPHDHDGSPLPVVLDPYGGPHGPRVVRTHNAHLTSQWFADQGFAVVVADGRGTPGRGSAWERAVLHDLATPVLDDQVSALHHAAQEHPLDLARVAIRGWSFGGYLAALAVLRRPDVFHAAIAGAPVTEWRLYDTHYTERYLGDPNAQPEVYDANSLLPLAAGLTRPLLLIHGLADDNVVAAHTLRLSSALLAGGRPHEVLPLVGITHMTSEEVVAEHLLLHQLDFLRRSLSEPAVLERAKD